MKRAIGGRARIGILGLALMGVLTSACGGSSKAGPSEPTAQEAAGQGSSTTTSTSAAPKKAGGDKSSKATTTTTTTAPGKAATEKAGEDAPRLKPPDTLPPDGSARIDIRAEMAKPCVKPGETQTITIHAPAGSGVVYNTYYADGKHGLSKEYYGGNNGGNTDENGTYSDSWVLAPGAAPGEAVVVVLGAQGNSGRGETRASFRVAEVSGSCG